jgi:hypothetical protein
MRIKQVESIDTGLRIHFVEGPPVEIEAEDAFKLQRWIRIQKNYEALYHAMWRADRKAQSRKDNVT